MNPRADAYRELRRALGTQSEVAAMLGLTVNALSLRELGLTDDIREECFLALQLLMAIRDKKTPRRDVVGRVRTL